MPGNYDGKSGQITTASALTVTGATNLNPITITVSGALPASFFTAGYLGAPAAPLVDITGVQGNTAANGQFVATPTGASTFTIPVAGNGAYTAGGSVQPLNLQSLYTLPSDGDSDNSASISAWGQATGDRTQFLAAATGFSKLAGRLLLSQTRTDGTSWASIVATLVANTSTVFTLAALNLLRAEGSLAINGAAGPYSVKYVNSGDIVHVSLRTTYIQSTTTNPMIQLFYAIVVPGSSAPAFGAYAPILTASCPSGNPATTPIGSPIACDGWINCSNGILYVQPVIFSTAGGATTASLINDASLLFEAWRPTSMPQ